MIAPLTIHLGFTLIPLAPNEALSAVPPKRPVNLVRNNYNYFLADDS